MILTTQQIEQIRELNEKIRQEELRMRTQYFELKKHFENLVSQNLMDDFNMFDCRVAVWSYDDEFNKKHNVETGDPFYTSDMLTTCYLEDDESFFMNWNEAQYLSTDTFAQMYFCWTMHDIVYHSHLDWEDILAIEDVWLEMKVDLQFWTKKMI
ncbi:MAG: hypothetical protein WCY06_10310 [Flavobacteriaceae bacterium]